MKTLQGAEVCVIGNLNMDLLIRGVDALPRWGQEVIGTGHEFFPSGQAGYMALGLASLGAPVSVVGVAGDDGEGRRIAAALRDAGADIEGLRLLSGENTGLTVALVRPDGERAFASSLGCSSRLTVEMMRESVSGSAGPGVIAMVGLFMTSGVDLDEARGFLAEHRRAERFTVLDTGWDPGGWQAGTLAKVRTLLSEVDLFLPNLDEAEAITGKNSAEDALEMLREYCPGSIVVKCGSEGSLAWHEGAVLRHRAIATRTIDAVGAGDAFDAGLVSALQRDLRFEDALSFAHATASIYVSRAHRRHPGVAEVERLLATLRSTTTETGDVQ